MTSWRGVKREFVRLQADSEGQTAVIFGLAAIPMMLMAGAAIDYSRAATQHSNLQQASDAAVLSATRYAISLVPFTALVNVGTSTNAAFLDTAGRSSIHWQNFHRPAATLLSSFYPTSKLDLFAAMNNRSWGGCVEERPVPLATTDTAALLRRATTFQASDGAGIVTAFGQIGQQILALRLTQ